MNTRKLAYSSLFVALGIVLPVVFSSVGLSQVLLPAHVPVLLAGFVCGPVAGMLVGVLSPILSAILIGIPSLAPPLAQVAAVELAIYGLLTGLFYERLHAGVYVSLLGAMFAGRAVYGVLAYLILPMFGVPQVPLWAPLIGAISIALPGVVAQIICIPPMFSLIRRRMKASPTAKRRPGRCPRG
ncbi:MAG: ECF transporter S component [Bacillota bacterium]